MIPSERPHTHNIFTVLSTPFFFLVVQFYSLVVQPSATREVSSEMASEEASSKEILCYGFNQVRNGGEKMKFVFIRN